MIERRTRRRPWTKVWESWYTSPSHLALSGETLAVGLRALLLVNAIGWIDGDAGLLLDASGDPMDLAALARAAHFPAGAGRRSIEALVMAGTVAVWAGEKRVKNDAKTAEKQPKNSRKTAEKSVVFCFPNLVRWQGEIGERQRIAGNIHVGPGVAPGLGIPDQKCAESHAGPSEIRDQRSDLPSVDSTLVPQAPDPVAAAAPEPLLFEDKPTLPPNAQKGPSEAFAELALWWNGLAAKASLTPSRGPTKARLAAMRARMREHPDRAWWEDLMRAVEDQLEFLGGGSERGWRADLGWILAPENAQKVIERKFVRVGRSQPSRREHATDVAARLVVEAEERERRQDAQRLLIEREAEERWPAMTAVEEDE